LYNRFDNRVERTATVRSTGRQTGLYNRFDNGFDNRLYRVYKHFTRLSNRFDSRLYCVNGALGLISVKISQVGMPHAGAAATGYLGESQEAKAFL